MLQKALRLPTIFLTCLVFACVGMNDGLAQESAPASVITWSPDGQKVAIGRFDGTIEIRDVSNNTSVFLGESIAYVNALAWNPQDPDLIAVGHAAPRIRVFDVTTGERLFNLDSGLSSVEQVVWNADGTKLAAAANSYWTDLDPRYEIQIWDAVAGALINTLEAHTDNVRDIAWSQLPDDDRLVSVSSDSTAIVWDTQSGAILDVLSLNAYGLEVAWNSTLSQLAVLTTEDEIYFWDTSDIPFVALSHETYSSITHAIYSDRAISNLVWRPGSPTLAFIDGGSIRIYQIWSDYPYISNILPYTTYSFDWGSGDYLVFEDVSGELQLLQPPFDDDPELKPTPTGEYESPTPTDTPEGTPLVPTSTEFPHPIPDAGIDQTVTTNNGISAKINLDASSTVDPQNLILIYRWFDDADEIARGKTANVNLGIGIHNIRLLVVYPYGNNDLTLEDVVTINVVALPTLTPTFTIAPTNTLDRFVTPTPTHTSTPSQATL